MKARYHVEIATGQAEVETHLAAWWDLHACRLEDNVYAAPAFLSPVYRQLHGDVDCRVAFVYRHAAGQQEMVASAPFGATVEVASGVMLGELDSGIISTASPMLHRDFAAQATSSLCQWFGRSDHPWSIVCWPSMPLRSLAWKHLAHVLGGQAWRWRLQDRFESAALDRRTSFDAFLQDLPRVHRDACHTALRQLQSAGEVEVKLHRSLRDYDLIRRFMVLEHARGERRAAGTEGFGDAALFASVTEAMGACNELFFVEILARGMPISISASYVDGTTVFGFKTVSDPSAQSTDPELVNLLEATRLLHQDPILRCGQSISNEGSWATRLWTDAHPFATVLAATRGSAVEATLPPRSVVHAATGLTGEVRLLLSRGAA